MKLILIIIALMIWGYLGSLSLSISALESKLVNLEAYCDAVGSFNEKQLEFNEELLKII